MPYLSYTYISFRRKTKFWFWLSNKINSSLLSLKDAVLLNVIEEKCPRQIWSFLKSISNINGKHFFQSILFYYITLIMIQIKKLSTSNCYKSVGKKLLSDLLYVTGKVLYIYLLAFILPQVLAKSEVLFTLKHPVSSSTHAT